MNETGAKAFRAPDSLPTHMAEEERSETQRNNRSGEAAKAEPKAPLPPVDARAGEALQVDDRTMLRPERKEGDSKMKTLTVAAKNEKLEEVTAFVDAFLEERDWPMRSQMQMDLCVEEVFVNIASYAYGDGAGDVEIRIEEEDGEVTVVFLDSGTPYDPLAKADPDTTLSAQERQIGGLGIFLVKKNMDAVSYRREDGKNIFTMTKKR